MRFSFSDEQSEFRAVVRRVLADKSPPAEVRRLMETDAGYDPQVWRQLSRDLGVTGIHIPEIYGGQGFGVDDLGIVVEEMGRALLCAPFFSSTVLAATVILEAGTEDQKTAILPGLASGEVRAALAFTEANGRWDTAGMEATATPGDGGFRLHGTKSFVIDGHSADLIVVAARRPDTRGHEGLSLFTLPGDAPGAERRQLQTADATRKLARIDLDGAQADLLGEEGAAAVPLARTLDIARICLACEMVGGAERLREAALEYSLMRVQFGRLIGSFQAIKHKSADMLLDVELAKSAAYYAAAAAAEGDEDVPALASLAKAAASDAYMQTAINAVQIHGGIGFTWDHDTHLWFKRARSSQVLLGDASHNRELLMQHWNV